MNPDCRPADTQRDSGGAFATIGRSVVGGPPGGTGRRWRRGISGVMLAGATALAAAGSWALPRAWVSVAGIDAGPCSRATPCRTFTYAISQVDAGGEVNALDAGEFGEIVITRSVTVNVAPGITAAIVASDGPAVTVAAGAADRVVLRGLTITSNPTRSGIVVSSAGQVYIENCVLDGPGEPWDNGYPAGIRLPVSPQASTTAYIIDTVVRKYSYGVTGSNAELDRVRLQGNLEGISIAGGGRVVVARSVLSGNRNDGAVVVSGPAGVTTVLVIRDSLLSNNFDGAFGWSPESAGKVDLILSNNTIADNRVAGIRVFQGYASEVSLMLSNNTITGNSVGVRLEQGVPDGTPARSAPPALPQAFTRQDNTISGNGTDVQGGPLILLEAR